LGLTELRLDLAHTRVARGLLAALELPADAADEAHALLARKDRDGLARLLEPLDRPPALRRATVALCELFGAPARVMPRAEAVLRGTGVDEALEELRAVLDHLPGMGVDVPSRMTVDLGEARGFDYYSGIRMRGWAAGVHHPLVRGGRYDGLPRRYGVPRPATGFAIDLDAVEAALAVQGRDVAGAEPAPAHLVALAPSVRGPAARERAHAVAARARAEGRRAWVQPAVTRARAQALADDAGADRLTFVDEHGAATWVRGPHGWAAAQESE
jgi:ATP phosphoribosyltransferase regulatory subunit